MSDNATDAPDELDDQGGEFGVSVGPDLFIAPGGGDVDPEPTDVTSSEIGMFYTHGGTPC